MSNNDLKRRLSFIPVEKRHAELKRDPSFSTMTPAEVRNILRGASKRAEDRKQRFAFRMKHNPTPPESIFWWAYCSKMENELRQLVLPVRIRRQRVLFGYIVDFYCPKRKLVIEIDGKYHREPEQEAKDRVRDAVFKQRGYRVMRIQAWFIFNQIEKVTEAVRQVVVDQNFSHPWMK